MVVMPVFCNRDFITQSEHLLLHQGRWFPSTDNAPCMLSEHLVFTVLEQAAKVGCRAFVTCMNVIGYKVCGLVIGVGTGRGGGGGGGGGLGVIYIRYDEFILVWVPPILFMFLCSC